MNNIAPHEKINLPDGFTIRAAQMSDLESVVDMINDSNAQEDRKERHTYDVTRSEWEQPVFDLEKQSQLVVSADGRIAGYVEIHVDVPAKMYLWHRIHTDYGDTTVGNVLTQWAADTAQTYVHKVPEDVRVVFHAGSRPNDDACEQRFMALGMEKVRYFHEMRIDMTEAPEVPPVPAGFTLRNYRHPQDLRAALRADLDAFKDHWGYVEPDFEEEVKWVKHKYDNDTLFDPELNVLAIDNTTGDIAGVILARIQAYDDANVAYVSLLGVLREYRGRGFGTLLLKEIFKRCFEKGQCSVTLGVDADSLTGATRLYERVGMYVSEVHTAWEKVLRQGRDTMTTDLDT